MHLLLTGHAFLRPCRFFTGGKMRALNLYTLTRINDSEAFSGLENALSGRPWHKHFSSHEAASLCALVNGLADCFMEAGTAGADSAASGSNAGSGGDAAGRKAGEQNPEPGDDWVSFFDGFYFSYTIEHISKEFDLLKFSANADCALNIELKSEAIEEDRIRKQLEQNRYYLSHVSRTILSYTYVMESNSLYYLNDHGFLRQCPLSELAAAMQRPVLQTYVEENIGQFFRAQDYLISPVRNSLKTDSRKYLTAGKTQKEGRNRRKI